MLGLELNFATIVVLLIIAALVVLAVHRLWTKGLCDSRKDSAACGGCNGCGAAEKMVADFSKAVDSNQ